LWNVPETRAGIRKRRYKLDGEMVERVRRLSDTRTR